MFKLALRSRLGRAFRPTVLMLVLAVLTLGAAALLVRPFWDHTPVSKAVPLPVPQGDQEIAWLNNATSSVAWERFVAALRRLNEDEPDLQLEVASDANAFPSLTTSVPELAVTAGAGRARLWFRWYKLTGDTGTREWIQALAQRSPPPLAVIGGGSSDRARDLAQELNAVRARVPSPPLLLITTATADQVDVGNDRPDLMDIYSQRSFRFCFTNRQMAEATADFIWNQDDLRPDAEPIYLVFWRDDPYSVDLFDRFHDEVLPDSRFLEPLLRSRVVRAVARNWGWLGGRFGGGGTPPGLEWEGLRSNEVRAPGPFWWSDILYSVGTFNHVNQWEAGAVKNLVAELDQRPGQRRPLLIVPATPQPARRFLRGLVRLAPAEAGRFVVASGDAIDFNTVYRDRNLNWPIQDLPFALVFFCHRNPVDPVAFQPEPAGGDPAIPDPAGRTSTGTQDLLLYRDIVETVVRSAYTNGGLLGSADELAANMHETHLQDGRVHFDDTGNQLGGGEYVVRLTPVREGDQVLPRARLQVWTRLPGPECRGWARVPVAGLPELVVEYAPGTGTQEAKP